WRQRIDDAGYHCLRNGDDSDPACELLSRSRQRHELEFRIEIRTLLPGSPVRIQGPHDPVIVIWLKQIMTSGHAAVRFPNLVRPGVSQKDAFPVGYGIRII